MTELLSTRQLYIKAKFYRLVALVFGVMGLLVFAILYYRTYQGDLINALSDPVFIAIVIFPFLPAVVLSWLASRLERKIIERHKNTEEKS